MPVLYGAYGNSDWIPNSELFYVGGANSIRAFSVRGIGPGSFAGFSDNAMSYIFQNGDLKLVGNLEYRHRLFGSLQGAVFIDAGNVWNIRERSDVDGKILSEKFQLKNFFREISLSVQVSVSVMTSTSSCCVLTGVSDFMYPMRPVKVGSSIQTGSKRIKHSTLLLDIHSNAYGYDSRSISFAHGCKFIPILFAFSKIYTNFAPNLRN